MSEAKQGDTVRVHYTGKLKDGQVFDSSRQRDPLELTLGAGHVIPGFEQAIEGMTPGQSKSVDIPVAEAYGDREDDKVININRSTVKVDDNIQVGQQVQLKTKDGNNLVAVVSDLSEATVTLDANHPLAGKDLVFDVELMEIV